MSEDTIPQMREHIKELEKQNKGLVSDNDTLTKTNRTMTARDAFREEGYPSSYGDLFAGQRPDEEMTSESMDKFVTDFGLTKTTEDPEPNVTADEGDQTPNVAPGSEDLALMSRSGSRPGDGGTGSSDQKTMTRDEWKDLSRTDPAAAKAAVSQGRVQVSKDNPYVPQSRSIGVANPYASSE